MKDIKFRAWESSRKEMIYCSFADVNVGRYRIYHLPVMQYTGLKDKNGVEIYESDIVKIHIGHEEWLDKSMIVEWIDGAFCLHIPGREKVTSLIFYADGVQVRRGHRNIGQFIEVIGNIYEHPQLTEAK